MDGCFGRLRGEGYSWRVWEVLCWYCRLCMVLAVVWFSYLCELFACVDCFSLARSLLFLSLVVCLNA